MPDGTSKLQVVIDVTTGVNSDKAINDLRDDINSLDKELVNLTATEKKAKQQDEDNAKTLNMIAAAAVGAAVAIVGFAKSAIDETEEYNRKVRELSTSIGLSAEETSRIIQVSDDYKISIDQVKTTLAFMTKSGLQPSIENLANLADEFVNTKDKTEFAEKAVKLLGRGWTTLIPILSKGGDAFREQAAAVDESLIATDKSIQASLEYSLAMDALEDRVTSLKLSIGNGLIPVLTDLLGIIDQTVGVHKALMDAVSDGTISYVEAYIMGNKYNLKMMEQEDIIATLTVAYDKVEEAKQKELEATGLSTSALIEERRALQEASDVIKPFKEYTDGLATATDLVAAAYRRGIEPTDDFAEANSRVAVAIGEVTEASLGKDALEALTEAYRDGTISEKEYDKQARFIMGSLLGMPDASIVAQETLQDLNEDLADGKITAQEYAKALFDMGINLDNLNGKKAYVDVYTTFHEQTVTSPGSTGGSGTGSGTFAPGQGGAQHGANFIVPPGYPNDSYPLNVSSGEHVVVVPKNQVSNTWNVFTNAGTQPYDRDYNLKKALAS